MIDRIRDLLGPLRPQAVELIDDSHLHAGHAGARDGGGHYRLTVVSAAFAGLPLMRRHRLVYDLLASLMKREIHALSITAKTPEEIAGQPASPPSPNRPR